MPMRRLLVANRGEIAIRVMRAARELGVATVAIHSRDDARSLHVRSADEARALEGEGPAAYLDIDSIIATARDADCDALHPGVGFLSEREELAIACNEADITFVGPFAETLGIFGDKTRARDLAKRCGVPVLPGTDGATSVAEVRAFLASLGKGGSVVIKAVAGGGGRGMRIVRNEGEVEDAFQRCASEARAAFGRDDLYVEQRLHPARHVEVQIVGDGSGGVVHLGERECTLQRRSQKLIEIAPSPSITPTLRDQLTLAAIRMGEEARYRGLGTVEFLIPAASLDRGDDGVGLEFVFIEANARLQVEHTVTEEVTGIDLVRAQLEIASGRSLDEIGLVQRWIPEPRGYAVQARVNMETLAADGSLRPSGGRLSVFEAPSGPGLRTDSYGYAGYETNPRFDSLLAKLVAHHSSGEFRAALDRCYRALCEFRIEGVATNIGLLQNLLRHPAVLDNQVHTTFVEDELTEIVGSSSPHPRLFFDGYLTPTPESRSPGHAGAKIDASDPLAVLDHGKGDAPLGAPASTSVAEVAPAPGPDGTVPIPAPIQGTIVQVDVAEGERVRADQPLLVMEAMKMEHVIAAGITGVVRRVAVAPGDTVFEGHPLVHLEAGEVEAASSEASEEIDLDHIRPDLAEVHQRHAVGLDASRPDAVARRRKTRQRTARENVDDLCDEDSFVEYGALMIAAQRRRRSLEDLIERTPADGLVGGIGRINAALHGLERSRCVVMSYDYTVLAGTQGMQNHRKKDRLFEIAEKQHLPLVFFTEGGGGRPGDTDATGVAGLDCLAFNYFGRLSGRVPLIGINSGRCFAGNAALLGCCDVIIATEGSNIGMGGPAMIEGGGLGVFRPEDVGPLDVQTRNGVVDIPVADEAEAVAVARRYLGYFQGRVEDWECADQRRLRGVIPENRLRIYDVREVIDLLADTGSVLELRRDFGLGMVTSLVRIEGRPVGVIANNPTHLAGAIDSNGADKAARFMQLCDAFEIPLLFLCDTPGIMVGPEVERTALVRHASRLFVTGASLSVPFFTIILRKGYGLGAQAMAGGSFKAPVFTVSWPTGEFGGMGLEGAVKLGFRKELAAIEDPAERKQAFEEMVDRMYEHGKAVNMASHFEIDDVIDPLESRRWIVGALEATPPAVGPRGGKRPCVDTW
jgi:acetyl/propionyl-CoA carboxylase alpha subunit/acetyl-CoA carboxylase carboxyltransferase component